MKRLFTFLYLTASVLLTSCSGGSGYSIIRTEVPERPAGQEDMLLYAAPPLDTVRIGFIGLGMRGPGAVERMCQIDGTKIVALCDVEQDRVESASGILQRRNIMAPKMPGCSSATGMTSTLSTLSLTGKCMPRWRNMRWSTGSMWP